jgi:hypothetical protein
MRLAFALSSSAVLLACEAPAEKATSAPPSRLVAAATSSNATEPALRGVSSANPPGTRRAYGTGDVRLDACIAKAGDRSLKGTSCGTGFVVFGPYVTVPAGSEVELQFGIKADSKLAFAADLVSEMGGKFLAGVNEQGLEAGERRSVGFRVSVPSGAAALESRVYVRADERAGLSIDDFSLTVRAAH